MKDTAAYTLEKPDPDKDAQAVYDWFNRQSGAEILALMGNDAHEYVARPSVNEQRERLRELVEREAQKKQIIWMIHANNKTIGIVWIDLEESDSIEAPSVRILIGDASNRRRGIGFAVIKEMISYAYRNLPTEKLYARYPVTNDAIAALFKKLGFEADGDSYSDEGGVAWQNVSLVL